jgi:uncharacterized protein (DUF433 family)
MATDLAADRIIVAPGVRSGQPIVKGTRITVWDILGWLAAGMSENEILFDFPDLTHDDIIARLQFAYGLKDKVNAEAARK